jgi:exodeoxyribonuclease VII large subunit
MFDQPSLFRTSLTVTDLTRYLRQVLESDPVLQDVWVNGEISNLSRPSSGHVYFTLKDAGAALKCVIWRSTMLKLRIDLQSGMAVEAHGQVSLYERDGAYQLYVDAVRPAGEGRLYQEFMRLKARLEAEGLFEEERKRGLPERPRRIGIVTSPTGAALQDMLNTLQRRYPLVEVVIAGAAVQGVEAPPEIVRAIRALNQMHGIDVILLARGGGSMEDLWAFNDERVVRAIVDSRVPVVCGVGHETDFTLADFAADRRAPTPTGAAVMVTPDVADLKINLRGLVERLNTVPVALLENYRVRLDGLNARMKYASPVSRLRSDRQRLDDLLNRLQRAAGADLQLRSARQAAIFARLQGLNPLAVLKRGYALVQSQGVVIRHSADLAAGKEIQVRMADGEVDATVTEIRVNGDLSTSS